MDLQYKFNGRGRFKIPQPWYERTSREPWDEGKVSWLMDNRNRRLIIRALQEGPKNVAELEKSIEIGLEPHLTDRDETGLKIKIPSETLKTHLSNLLRSGLVKMEGRNCLRLSLKRLVKIKTF